MRFLRVLLLAAVVAVPAARAVIINETTYQTTAPTDADISHWSTGWGASGITGWDYVGNVNGSSAVYLGNGWVITVAHVGMGDFTLAGTIYSAVANSVVTFGTADIAMFQLTSSPSLPSLSITSTAPITLSTQVVMVGYGDGDDNTNLETWGANTVTTRNQNTSVEVPGLGTYTTRDFITAYGTTGTVTNTAQVVVHDSGGGAFSYNGSSWQLAGLMEALDPATGNSYFVQLSTYRSMINTTIANSMTVPEPATVSLVLLLLPLLLWQKYRKIARPQPALARVQRTKGSLS